MNEHQINESHYYETVDMNRAKTSNRLKGVHLTLDLVTVTGTENLMMAATLAEGKTIINRVYHLDRGYENIEKKLRLCGANIKRVK